MLKENAGIAGGYVEALLQSPMPPMINADDVSANAKFGFKEDSLSVLLEFSMFPTDKSESVSEYVSKVIKYIDESGVEYKLTAMGTIIETDTVDEALEIVKGCYKVLEPYSNRVYSSLKMDIRKGKSDRLNQKIESIKKRIGDIKT